MCFANIFFSSLSLKYNLSDLVCVLGVLLTMLSLMRALDLVKHQEEMMSYFDKLLSIDQMRSNYYADLRMYFGFLCMFSLGLKNEVHELY
jgi:hypothetical protein